MVQLSGGMLETYKRPLVFQGSFLFPIFQLAIGAGRTSGEPEKDPGFREETIIVACRSPILPQLGLWDVCRPQPTNLRFG